MLTATFLVIGLVQPPQPSRPPQATAGPSHRSVLVVEAPTGQPIAGAEVLCVDEISAPVWGEEWWTHKRLTDGAGRTRVPRPTKEAPYGWLFVRAEGYGGRAAGDQEAFSTYGMEEVRVELMPETPVPIELFDFTGAPLPLAHLGVALGCGHTCDLISAVTDASGRATLRGFHNYDGGICDLFIVHPEVGRTTYSHVPMEDMIDGVVPVYAPSNGELLRGRVLLADRSPAAGYAVGTRMNHRGPWAVTDAGGRFQLYGWDRDSPHLSVYDVEGELVAGFSGARSGMERILTLDGSERDLWRGSPDGAEAPVFVPVTIDIKAPWLKAAGLRPHDRAIAIEAWDPRTGRSFTTETREPEAEGAERLRATLRLPPGAYLVEAGRSDTPYAPVGLGEIRVAANSPEISIPVERMPAPRLVTLEVPVRAFPAERAGFTFMVYRRNFAESFEPGEEGVERLEDGGLVVERFAVPRGRVGFSLELVLEGALRRIDLEVDPRTLASDRWTLRRMQR
ncbi:MAG: hypothetical protein AAGG01_08605 [Planctomycetota bacterium]